MPEQFDNKSLQNSENLEAAKLAQSEEERAKQFTQQTEGQLDGGFGHESEAKPLQTGTEAAKENGAEQQ
jgi:hypothetical protein